ncbi:MAG TPA: hypothetical protein VJ987_03040 [Anaerolineales bacterium]|nr:hypothetical protein [Anaerolineales bacterium]
MKKIFLYTVFPVLLALLGIGIVVGDPFAVVDNKEREVRVDFDESVSPVMISVMSMYVPAPAEHVDGWLKSTCVGMTSGGCEYFKDNQAQGLLDEVKDNIGSTSDSASEISKIDEDTRVWKVRVTTFTKDAGDEHSKENVFDVFALVRRGEGGKWYLDRVLNGHGISL